MLASSPFAATYFNIPVVLRGFAIFVPSSMAKGRSTTKVSTRAISLRYPRSKVRYLRHHQCICTVRRPDIDRMFRPCMAGGNTTGWWETPPIATPKNLTRKKRPPSPAKNQWHRNTAMNERKKKLRASSRTYTQLGAQCRPQLAARSIDGPHIPLPARGELAALLLLGRGVKEHARDERRRVMDPRHVRCFT